MVTTEQIPDTDGHLFDGQSDAERHIDRTTLNQTHIREEIHRIQADSSMSDKQKAILMQTLMTRDYVTISYRSPSAELHEMGHPLSALDQAKTYHDSAKQILGCAHYQRNCKLQYVKKDCFSSLNSRH